MPLTITPMTAIALIAAGLALAYGATLLRAATSWPRTLLKTAPVATLAAMSWQAEAPLLLTAALAFSALGDAALSREGDRAFIAGLSAFLIAHVAYVPLFWQGAVGDLFWGGGIAGLLVIAAIVRWLWPHLGEMRLQVLVYIAAIAAMGGAALTGPAIILAGAVLFMVSDTVLAAETFVFRDTPRRWTAPTIWVTYIAAQITIFIGVSAHL